MILEIVMCSLLLLNNKKNTKIITYIYYYDISS